MTRTVEGDVPSVELAIDPDANVLLAGTRVGPWRVEHLLGAGAMGDVYAVVHEEIGKRAAMKVLHCRHALSLDAERLFVEGQVANRVRHPAIVDIFGAGELDGRPYLVMERLFGTTLETVKSSLPLGHVIDVLRQLSDVLRASHSVGVIHRDLKPENVFLISGEGQAPRVKLLDWGIAKILDDTKRRTMEGQLVGTPDYLSPEQACGKPVSPSADVYALGVIAYELFLGRLPFDAQSLTEVLMCHVREVPRPPNELWPSIPVRLEDLLLAMLAKDPHARPSLRTIDRELSRIADEFMDRSGIAVALASHSIPCRDRHALGATIAEPALSGAMPNTAPKLKRFGQAILAVGAVIGVATVRCDRPVGQAGASSISTQHTAAHASPLPVIAPPAPSPSMTSTRGLPNPVAPVPTATRPPPRDTSGPEAPRTATRPLPRRSVAATTSPPITPPAQQTSTSQAAPAATETAPSSTAVVDLYVAVGRELHTRRTAIDVSDLWTRYRLIRIYQSLGTPTERHGTTATLQGILREIRERLEASRS